MNFISCHIQNSLLLCGGSESGKRNSLSSFGSWSEWAQEWLEIHSRAIRLQWHKLAARRAQILPDTDRFTWIVHCRGALAVLSTGEKKNKPVWSRTQGDVYGTALMSSGTQKYWQHSWGQQREIRKTNLNMGDLKATGGRRPSTGWSQSWNHGATQPRWPAEALQDHSRLDPSDHGRDAEVHPSHQSGSYHSLGWRKMMLWDQKTLHTLTLKRNNMYLKVHHSFLIYRIELQFLSDFTQRCFPSLD